MDFEKIISNYDAIRNMSAYEMYVFLDHVYTTGINNGMYVERLESDSDEHNDISEDCPYNEEWLSSPAEEATKYVFDENGDTYLPDAFVKSVFRNAGIDENEFKKDE
ncbi:MAG: hypothetical protein K2O36_04495 [Ruminococcus sp.]|nr:hypothetical protein [Ruminococcus sp.]